MTLKCRVRCGKTLNNTQAVQENDFTHAKLMEFEPLLEASGERNLLGIDLKHGDYPCHCLAQTVSGEIELLFDLGY